MSAKAEIITIGDEILYGQTLDTNSHWISGELDQLGIKVIRKTTIPDLENHILAAFAEAETRADIILITGGLGPTNDDLTKPCLAKYFGVELEMNEEALTELTELYARSGWELSELNRGQAIQPVGAAKITNELGTAPGIWLEQNDTIFISMPGVPFEMKGIMEKEVLPKLKARFVTGNIHHRILKTGGIAESTLAEKLESWEANLPSHMKLAYLPSLAQVKLRLTAIGEDLKQLEIDADEQIQKCIPLIQKYIYATENISLEERVGQLLREQGKTISCAESCTGGYLSHLFTTIPGSSDYFQGSYVAYSYEIKEKALKVDHKLLTEKGAVSEEVVIQMARNIRKVFNTDIGVSLSGIAGPGGATPDKPVGTIWIAYSDANNTFAKKFIFAKDRKLNIQLSAIVALNIVRRNLMP
ncbi:MAG: competence/damage-inducible protein A [Cytophagales bacterium]|nr:competence/damage-inducible protein A [Cytophagales bacterium]